MAIIHSTTKSWTPYELSIIETDIDIEEKIKYSSIRNTLRGLNSINNTILSPSSKEISFSDNIPTRVNERAHINIIDMYEKASNEYRAFFIYEDLFSKYVVLKPLKEVPDCGSVSEITEKLIDIFSLIGAPRILQSSNGRSFSKKLVRELRKIIPALEIVHGNILRHNYSCRDFKMLVESWQKKNSSKLWHEGLYFIQILENTSNFPNSQNKPSQNSPAKIFSEQNLEHDLVRFIGNKNSIEAVDEIWTEEEWLKKTVENDSYENVNEELNTDTKIDKFREDEMTHATSLIYKSDISIGNEEASNINVELYKSPIPSSISSNESIDGNDKNENVDSFNLINSVITGTEKSSTDAKKFDVPKNDNFDCYLCDRVFKRMNHLKNHMRSHKKTLKNKSVTFQEKDSKTSNFNNNSKKEKNGQPKSLIANDEKENDSDVENKVISARINSIRCSSRTLLSHKNKKMKLSKLSNDSLLKCKICKKKFDFQSFLERHMRIHTNERPYICKACNKSFKQLGHLNQHAMSHIDYRSHQCLVCDNKFASLQLLKNHVESHNDINDPTTISKSLYRLYECDFCKKEFTSKSVLERHIFTHTQDRHYSCEFCNKKFKQLGHVKSHLLMHTKVKKFECTICSKRFSFMHSLKKHMLIHTGQKPYQCDICGMRFLEKRNLNGHLWTHTNEKPHLCTICGKKYTLADTLRRHKYVAHESGRTYQCEVCAKMFKQLGHLTVHKKVHTDERPFQCYICDKSFKFKNVLTSHLAIHANFRPFECDICKATFTRKGNLQSHIHSAHTDNRPYSCKICHRKFKQISHLNGHIIIHSIYTPFKCQYCDKRFNRLDNLKKHMQLHKKNNE